MRVQQEDFSLMASYRRKYDVIWASYARLAVFGWAHRIIKLQKEITSQTDWFVLTKC